MRDTPVRSVIFRILVIPALYLTYTAGIWLLPTRAPALPDRHPALRSASDLGRYRAGQRVWLDNGCQTCHSVYGLGGHIGPDLTNTARPGMEAYIRGVVRDGRLAMPAFELRARELDDLVDYLQVINATGQYPPHSITDPVFGGKS